MATFKELHTRLEYYVDDSVDFDTAITLFNACLEDLSDIAGFAKTSEATINSGQATVALPTDLIDIVELKKKMDSQKEFLRLYNKYLVRPSDLVSNDWNKEYDAFERFDTHIELIPVPTENGTLLIRYIADLPSLKSPSDYASGESDTDFLNQSPEIKNRFHDALALYAAMKYMQNYKDEIPQKQDFQGEYMEMKRKIQEDTMKRLSNTKSRRVYQTRAWS